MRMIKVFDSADYEPHWTKFKRDSVRAIIFIDGKLLMVRSQKYGEYKFPGGGIEGNETHAAALIREVMEETGYRLLPESINEYGKTLRILKGMGENEIFEQESFYYICTVDENKPSAPAPDDGYEAEYGYEPILVSLDCTIATNEKLLDIPEIPWTLRDLTVLQELKQNHMKG
ncbi:MAG: NUDIX domain-containing protein [Defluviitaleaceae bacterium]|nr:NUDIX domain-containing protein [Defluviitaleaceae bacterium]